MEQQATQNYFKKDFYNITTFDTWITRSRINKSDEDVNQFFDNYRMIFGFYASSNHVNVYIILFIHQLTLPAKVDTKLESNVYNDSNNIKRKYYLKPDHDIDEEIIFYERSLKGFGPDIVFHTPINKSLETRFCFNENGPEKPLSISYGFVKDDFLEKWNSISLRDPHAYELDNRFSYPFLRQPHYPKINVVYDTRVSPIRYFDESKLLRPDLPKRIRDDSDDIVPLVLPPSHIVDVRKFRKNKINDDDDNNTIVKIDDMEFTPIPKPPLRPTKTKIQLPPPPPPLRASLREPTKPIAPTKPPLRPAKPKDDDPNIF